MTRIPTRVIVACLLVIATTVIQASPTPQPKQLQYGSFGNVTLWQPAATPQRSVLLFSDRGGADAATRAYAQGLVEQGSFVVGIDLDVYMAKLESLTDACSSPADHVQELAHWMERHVGEPTYQPPYVVGIGAGADFAYAMATQAPSGTFAGVATLGYDFDYRLKKTFCAGDAGLPTAPDGDAFRIVPMKTMPLPWLSRPFAPGARRDGPLGAVDVALALSRPATPRDGAALASALDALNQPPADEVATDDSLSDLPITEIAPQGSPGPRIAIMLTGDGGWAGLDKGVAAVLSQHGVRVVGLSSLQFFWHKRTPQDITDATTRIVAHYAARYPNARFVLIGYSFGASLVPVVGNRLPDVQRSKIAGGVMISPDDSAVFEIKVGDWFGNVKQADALPLASEVAHAKIPLVCVSGITEDGAWCPLAAKLGPMRLVQLPGGHHYDGDYDKLGAAILDALPK